MASRLFGFSALVIIAVMVTTAIFFYAKGYRINFNQKTISGTGIIQISSLPKGAAVYIDEASTPKDATDVSLTNLAPGKYKLRLSKNGFIDWTKEVEVRAGLVTQVEALLFPSAPNLRAVTFSGVTKATVSPNSELLVYSVNQKDKEGLWVLDLSDRPLFFSKEPKQIARDSSGYSFSTSSFEWSPESKSILVRVKAAGGEVSFLLDASSLNEQFTDVSGQVADLKSQWTKDAQVKAADRINALGNDIKTLITGAKKVLFSPEEERVLVVQADGKAVVYDSKSYLSFEKTAATFNVPTADNYLWYPESAQSDHDSRHLILIRKDSISIVEADGSNEMTIYTGSFDPSAVFAWPNGSKLLISTSLNSSASKQPNLYSIDLR